MKKALRIIAFLCVFSMCLCSSLNRAHATEPRAQVLPDPDQGGSGLNVDYLFHVVYTSGVSNFLPSSDYYVGRSMLSGTNRFGYVVTMYHSLASTTHNYKMRGGLCYLDVNSNTFIADSYVVYTHTNNGTSYVVYLEPTRFTQDRLYYVFLKNLISGGYVTGSVSFFREPT